MFSHFLGYFDTQEAHALIDKRLREVNDNPDSRFCTLKKRFREHFALLRKEKEFGHETVQHMINILGTYGNYDEELKRVVVGNTKGPRSSPSQPWSGRKDHFPSLTSKFNKPSKTTPNGYKPVQEDDTTFLTEIFNMRTERPAYRQIVDEILQEATKNLYTKLKALEKELLQLVKKQVKGVVRQEIRDRVNTEKQLADLAAKARLRSLIREALNAEAEHPTNR